MQRTYANLLSYTHKYCRKYNCPVEMGFDDRYLMIFRFQLFEISDVMNANTRCDAMIFPYS